MTSYGLERSDSEQFLNWLPTLTNFTFGQLFMWIGPNNDQMFKPTWTLPNFTFCQLCMWIGANYDPIGLPMDQTSDSGWTNSNFSCEMRQIMTRYDFLLPRRVILSNVRTNSQLNLILLVNISCELGQIMTRYDLLGTRWVILSNVQTDSNLT